MGCCSDCAHDKSMYAIEKRTAENSKDNHRSNKSTASVPCRKSTLMFLAFMLLIRCPTISLLAQFLTSPKA